MKKEQLSARCAARKSANRSGEEIISRRGNVLTIATGGRYHRGGWISATTETRRCSSAGEARDVECVLRKRREWYPCESARAALDNAVFFHRAAMRQARRRAHGGRQRI